MARAKRVTVTLSPEPAEMAEELRREAGCTTSAFLRQAILWKTIFAYGELKAKQAGREGGTAEEMAELLHATRLPFEPKVG